MSNDDIKCSYCGIIWVAGGLPHPPGECAQRQVAKLREEIFGNGGNFAKPSEKTAAAEECIGLRQENEDLKKELERISSLASSKSEEPVWQVDQNGRLLCLCPQCGKNHESREGYQEFLVSVDRVMQWNNKRAEAIHSLALQVTGDHGKPVGLDLPYAFQIESGIKQLREDLQHRSKSLQLAQTALQTAEAKARELEVTVSRLEGKNLALRKENEHLRTALTSTGYSFDPGEPFATETEA